MVNMEKISREDFEEWLFLMLDKLEEFENQFSKNSLKKLDYSIQSLDVLEKWILENFMSIDELLESTKKIDLDLFVRYVGETFRRNLKDSKWDTDIENPQNAYYNYPVIVPKNKPIPIAPHTLLTASVKRKKGNFMSTILRNVIMDEE